MSQIINELATIEVSNEVLQHLDVGNIYQNFSKNYRKLDDLKNFRTEYEKKNQLVRWWHNDKLRDAQLDSAEVQAEFSKTIGQLLMISIMQSKRLSEQQTQLNEQQGKLKTQADDIAEQAGELQKQHQFLAEQSAKLETLVHEYFELKGLTEDGAQKLIDIAKEVKTTKDGMLHEFAVRAKDVEALCGEVTAQMQSVSAQVNDQIHLNAEQTRSNIETLQKEMRQAILASETDIRNKHELTQQATNQSMLALKQDLSEAKASLIDKCNDLDTSLSRVSTNLADQIAAHQKKQGLIEAVLDTLVARMSEVVNDISAQKDELAVCAQQQNTYQAAQMRFEKEISYRLNRLVLIVACVAVVTLIMLGGMAHLLKWI